MTNIPRVPGTPLLGSLPEIRKDRIGLLKRAHRDFGDVAALDIGLFKAFLVTSPELCHEVLTTKADAFTKGLGLGVLARPLLGNGLLTSERDEHRRQRRLVSPAFVHSRIAGYAQTIAGCVDEHADRIARKSEVDLSAELMRMTVDIVGRTLFGADLGADADVIGEALTELMERMNAELVSALPMPPVVPTPSNLRARRVIRRVDEIVYRLIRQRRAEGRDAGDFLSMLLAVRDEDGGALTDQEVRDEAMTILMAGHETTANALAWAFYLLDQNPDERARLEAESDAVLGGALPSLESLRQLPFAARVFKEAMRLYPPAYMVVRRAAHAVEVGPCELKKGQAILVNIIGMHHRPDYFPDPEAFEPDRFSPAREALLPRHAYLPFGAGPRVCIGNHFALMEGQIALAHLAQRLRFERLPRSRYVACEPLLTLRPRGGFHVKVVSRTAAPLRAAHATDAAVPA
jgi:cytochrome P450